MAEEKKNLEQVEEKEKVEETVKEESKKNSGSGKYFMPEDALDAEIKVIKNRCEGIRNAEVSEGVLKENLNDIAEELRKVAGKITEALGQNKAKKLLLGGSQKTLHKIQEVQNEIKDLSEEGKYQERMKSMKKLAEGLIDDVDKSLDKLKKEKATIKDIIPSLHTILQHISATFEIAVENASRNAKVDAKPAKEEKNEKTDTEKNKEKDKKGKDKKGKKDKK